MPRKIRELIKDLKNAGWYLVPGGKGSHRKFRHDKVSGSVVIPRADGEDAAPYLEKQIKAAVRSANESK
jgi:predicted RNA binding protein YcfA (HicA-like mRNA interferase family)